MLEFIIAVSHVRWQISLTILEFFFIVFAFVDSILSFAIMLCHSNGSSVYGTKSCAEKLHIGQCFKYPL